MNLPAIRRLRQNYPKSWITWMVDRSVAPLLRNHPDVDEILEVDSAKLTEGAYRKDLIARVKKIRFELGVAANAEKFFHWMLFRAGVPVRVGWRRKWPFLLTKTLIDDKARARRHETASNLGLVGLVAPHPWDGSWSLPVDEQASSSIEKRLSKEFGDASAPVVAIHPGTSDPAKLWPVERFAEVASRLMRESAARILLIGGSEEEARSRELLKSIPEGARDWTGALELKELSALLRSGRVKTLISSDSGPVHVAWLHRKPVVALYAKNAPGSDPARWGPLSEGSVAIHKDMETITMDEVFTAARAILSK